MMMSRVFWNGGITRGRYIDGKLEIKEMKRKKGIHLENCPIEYGM